MENNVYVVIIIIEDDCLFVLEGEFFDCDFDVEFFIVYDECLVFEID